MNTVPLRLDRWIPIKDVRRLIWRYLRPIDILVLHCVHNSKYNNFDWNKFHGYDAARYGSINLIEWMIGNGFVWNMYFTIRAIWHNHTNVFDWALFQKKEPVSLYHLKALLHHNRLDVLDRFYYLYKDLFNSTFYGASASYGHISGMEWLEAHGVPIDAEIIFICAAKEKRRNVITWMLGKGYHIDEKYELSKFALMLRDIEFIQWLREHGMPWGDIFVEDDEEDPWDSIDKNFLLWLQKNGAPINWYVICRIGLEHNDASWIDYVNMFTSAEIQKLLYLVLKCGSENELQQLYSIVGREVFLDPLVFAKSAKYADESELEWLKSIGVPWDERTMLNAMENDNIDALRWLRENGAPEYEEHRDIITQMLRNKKQK